MIPFFLNSGNDTVAAIYEPPIGEPNDTGVLIVPPFGWDDQTSYRPRRDWSLALAAQGFPSLRIDLPGAGDSSGSERDYDLADRWSEAISSGLQWLRDAGCERIAAIAIGGGGLFTLQAIARGSKVDDLVLWGMPANGRTLVREFRAFGRLEQSQTGEPLNDASEGELRAGGHVLTPGLIAALSGLDPLGLLDLHRPERLFVLGRDGGSLDAGLIAAMRASRVDVRTDEGRGWGAALARPQSVSPTALFETVNAWLSEAAAPARKPIAFTGRQDADIGNSGSRVRERAALFEGAGQQLYAVIAEPLDAEPSPLTLILYNAGAIRRIGPNRMWTQAARRWAAAGVSVLRVDIEGIGDAGGDGGAYRDSDEPFYAEQLIDQARSALNFAVQHGLPDRFVLAGLCSGGFWAFQAALADRRVRSVVMLNPRLLFFDPESDGRRDARKLRRLLTPAGLRGFRIQKLSWRRAARLGGHLLRRSKGSSTSDPVAALRALKRRGQSVAMAFSEDEPLHEELRSELNPSMMEALGVRIFELPYKSHTLKPFKAQDAGHAVLDEVVRRTLAS